MKSAELIDKYLEGSNPSEVLDMVEKSVSMTDILAARKRIRNEAPKLFNLLNQVGLVHDFAADMLSGVTTKKLMKSYEIPSTLKVELDKLS